MCIIEGSSENENPNAEEAKLVSSNINDSHISEKQENTIISLMRKA